jgi:hypothetical protein
MIGFGSPSLMGKRRIHVLNLFFLDRRLSQQIVLKNPENTEISLL